jgi:hypothetical protein
MSSQRTVVFVDDDGWQSFDQVAIGLRRRGLRVVRLVTGAAARFTQMLAEPQLRWAADRLFYNEVISLSADGAMDRIFAILDGGRVVDVIAAEHTLRRVRLESSLGRALTKHSLSFSGTPPETLLDKFAVNARLADAGLAVPRQAWASELSASEAAEAFGLPLVVKRPLGAAGDEVRIARSRPEIERALEELATPHEPVFYQEHVTGTLMVYGAVAGDDGAVFEHGFRIVGTQRERGPAAAASVHDAPALLDAGRRVVELFGPKGFTSSCFIEAADGKLFHIDANIRPWGMIAVALPLGIDFTNAYVQLVGGRKRRPRKAGGKSTGPLPVFPHTIFEAARAGRPQELWAASAQLGGYVEGLGVRYCAETLARALLLVGRRVRHPQPAGYGLVDTAAATAEAAELT